MSQYDFGTINTATTDGVMLASILQSWRDALNSQHIGAVRPSYVRQGMIWVNSSTSPWTVNIYDGTVDIPMGYIDSTNDIVNMLTLSRMATVTTSRALTATDRSNVLLASAATGAITLTLPTAASVKNGFALSVLKSDTTANTVTIARSGADTIGALAEVTKVLSTANDAITLVSDGLSRWYSLNISSLLISTVNGKVGPNVTLNLSDIGNVTMGTPATNQVLTYNGTSWAPAAPQIFAMPAGTIVNYAGITAPTGWLFCNGTFYAHTAYPALYTAIGGTYGWTASTFAVPDLRGRVVAGLDNMGGAAAANRITAAVSGITGTTIGSAGGTQAHTLTVAEMPAHGHPFASTSINDSSPRQDATGGFMVRSNTQFLAPAFSGSASFLSGQQIGGAGGNGAHNNVQPTMVMNYIIKT